MKRLIAKPMIYLMMLLASLITGCSSSDDDVFSSLSGTAAKGAPLIGTVVITDANGDVSDPQPIESDGSFRVSVFGMQAPFLITVTEDGTGTVFYSFASRSNITVNVTQLTTLALAIASNGDPATLLANWGSGAEDSITQDDIENAAKIIYANLQATFQAQGINPEDYNFFNNPFDADSTGLDGLLDLILITFDFDLPMIGGAIVMTNNGTPVILDLDIDLSGIDFGDDNGGGSASCGAGNSDLPVVLKGKEFSAVYDGTSGTHQDGATVVFTFCENGSMYADGTLVSTSFTVGGSGNVQIYNWVNNGLNRKYEVVLLNGNFYEVNLNTVNNATFFGQFTPL